MSKAWFVLAVIALVLLAVLGRYEIVSATYGDMGGIVLRHDRWTGGTSFWVMGEQVKAGWSKPLGTAAILPPTPEPQPR